MPKGKRRDATSISSMEARFWPKVNRTDDPTECWLWNAGLNVWGYGRVHRGGGRSNMILAHRAAWIIAHGEIPEGMCVLHKCDVPACVNPNHLWLGTFADNSQDMMTKGRGRPGMLPELRGGEHPGAKLTEDTARYALQRRKSGAVLREIASELGVSEAAICMLAKGRTWKHLHMPSAAPVDVPQPTK